MGTETTDPECDFFWRKVEGKGGIWLFFQLKRGHESVFFLPQVEAKKYPTRFYAQVILCAALWGSAFPVIKLSYANLRIDIYGEQLLFAGTRFMLAGLLVLPFCRTSVFRSVRSVRAKDLSLVVLGQTVGQYLLFYYALSVSSGSLGALLGSSGSFWWVLIAPWFLGTPPPTRRQWLVLATCSLGIGLAVYAPGAGSGQVLLGSACFLGASLSGAIGAVGMKRASVSAGSRGLTAFSLFSGGVVLALIGSGSWESFADKYSLTTLWVTCYLAALSATAFTLWNRLIEKYSVNVLSAFRFLIPLFGVVESTLFVPGETAGIGIWTGGTIVIVSLIVLSREGSRSRA